MLGRLVLGVAALVTSACSIDLSAFTRVQPLVETVVLGESGPKILLLEIDGVISEAHETASFGLELPSMVARTREALDRARDDDDVAALLLRIQSPGGTVPASETLYHEVQSWKEETGKPVIAHFQGLATSGAYYLSMAADRVVSHPTSTVGSIGVIMIGLNFSGLMEKVGIADQTLTSGPFKDSGSAFRPMSEEERAHLQGVIASFHARFKEVVAHGRPELTTEAIDKVADGRIFTATQALELGLVDEIGYLETAVERAEAAAQIDESRVVSYHRPPEYRANVYSRAGSPPIQVVDIDLFSFGRARLAPGFYYLWPAVLQPW